MLSLAWPNVGDPGYDSQIIRVSMRAWSNNHAYVDTLLGTINLSMHHPHSLISCACRQLFLFSAIQIRFKHASFLRTIYQHVDRIGHLTNARWSPTFMHGSWRIFFLVLWLIVIFDRFRRCRVYVETGTPSGSGCIGACKCLSSDMRNQRSPSFDFQL